MMGVLEKPPLLPGARFVSCPAVSNIGAWWNKMLKTKAVAALKGKGKKLMPGEHNKAW